MSYVLCTYGIGTILSGKKIERKLSSLAETYFPDFIRILHFLIVIVFHILHVLVFMNVRSFSSGKILSQHSGMMPQNVTSHNIFEDNILLDQVIYRID